MKLFGNLFGGAKDPQPRPDPADELGLELDRLVERLLTRLRDHAPQVEQHSRRVAAIVKDIVECTPGSRYKDVRVAHLSTLLHDIGKLNLSRRQAIVEGVGGFGEVPEFLLSHPSDGITIIEQEADNVPRLKEVIFRNRILSIEAISAHHERADGSGYPNRLRSQDLNTDLPLLVGLVDAFDHLTVRVDEPGLSLVDALSRLTSLGIYNERILGLLNRYVYKNIHVADRSNIGGLTAAIEMGLNRYVREARTLVKDDADIRRLYHRISAASQKELQEIIPELSLKLGAKLKIPASCGRNVLLSILGRPLIEDIRREDIVGYDNESYDILIDDYRESEQEVGTQSVGLRPHLGIGLPLRNIDKIKAIPVVAYAPRKTDEKTGKAELWQPFILNEEFALFIR